jgi:hypothetical protein
VPAPEPQRPADSEAQTFIRSFMAARMKGDAGAVSALVAPGAVGSGSIRLSGPGERITGYTADLLGSGDTDLFSFRINVAFSAHQPGGEVEAEDVRVTWKDGLKVGWFGTAPGSSLALTVGKDGKLYLSQGQKTAVAGDLALLPAMARPWGAAPGQEFGVGKEGWSVAAVTLSGDKVLWVTRGNHPLLGVSQITWGSNPIMTPLDLLFEAGAVDAAWAPGGSRYAAVAVAQASGATTLLIYDVTANQRFGPDLISATGGSPDFTVKGIRWLSPTVVAFDVQKGSSTTGPWQYDVTTRVLTHP